MEKWRGKWALVTGASSGIGWALAEQLAAKGANLVLTARRADRLARLAQEVAARHQVRAEVLCGGSGAASSSGRNLSLRRREALPIEILINNAGFGAYGEFHKVEAQPLLDMVQVNVASVVHLTHLFLPAMVERRSGYVLIDGFDGCLPAGPLYQHLRRNQGLRLVVCRRAIRGGAAIRRSRVRAVPRLYRERIPRGCASAPCIWRARRSRTRR